MDCRREILLTGCPRKPIIPTENGFPLLRRLTTFVNSTNGSVALACVRAKYEVQGGQICDRSNSSEKL